MDEREQISAFAGELDSLISRFMDEFDLPWAAFIGVLAMKQVEMTNFALYDEEVEPDDFG